MLRDERGQIPPIKKLVQTVLQSFRELTNENFSQSIKYRLKNHTR